MQSEAISTRRVIVDCSNGEFARVARIIAIAICSIVILAALPSVAAGNRGTSWTIEPPHGAASASADAIVRAVPGRLVEAKAAVREAGGTVGDDLPIIGGFEAIVPAVLLGATHSGPVAAITENDRVAFETITYDESTTASNFARTSGATAAWAQGALGEGVGVAIIDTGVSSMNDFNGRLVFGPDLSGEGRSVDSFGHGTVMAGVVGGSGADSASRGGGAFTGVAPKSTIVSVKVAGRNGATDVSTVLRAMHWVSAYRTQFNIRVLNLSWGTDSTQDPSTDPLNYAVQRLWNEGIVVVIAAGNSGPTAGTITKPADDPVAISVGAFNDGGNGNTSDDNVPAWSSRGPTRAGLAKPDVVAPGRSLIATRSYGSAVEAENPKALVGQSYIKGSGTSQGAAVVSGVTALLLQKRPDLTPDQVKALLRSTSSLIAGTATGLQGAGRVQLQHALVADPGPAIWQALPALGTGSLESARGNFHVVTDCNGDGILDLIQGEITDRCDPWDPAGWTGNSWTGNSWTGNSWTGNSWTGNSWTGNSWTDASWTGNSWTGGTWTGNSWTGNSWTGNSWTGNSWTGNSWTGNAWTTGEYDGFLNVFWGAKPHWSQTVPGEDSERPSTLIRAY